MPIATSCADCGRSYTIKDELAGKKIKCKDCGAVIAVPVARKSGGTAAPKKAPPKKIANSDDDFLDALNSDEFADEENDDEQDELPRRSVAKRKPKPIAKKKSKASNATGLWAKIGAGIFTGLVVLGFVIRLIKAAGGFGVAGGVNWQEFQAPNGRYTVLMPGAAKSKQQDTPGVSTFLAETRNFACAVTHATLPAGTGASFIPVTRPRSSPRRRSCPHAGTTRSSPERTPGATLVARPRFCRLVDALGQ